MNIVHCLTHSILGGGQAVPFLLIQNLLKYHPQIRHTVMLPSGGIFTDRFRELSVDVIEFPFNTIAADKFIAVRKILKGLKPDIIHTHGRGASLYVRSISKTELPAKRIHTHHGFHVPQSVIKKISFLLTERIFMRNTDRTIAVSDSERVEIERHLGKSASMVVLPNIVDPAEVNTSSRTAEPELLKTHRFTIIMIGRDDPVKNYPLALETAAMVLQQTDTIQFCFVGLRSDHPGISVLAKKYPGQIIATGVTANPLPLLRRASLLMITSKREGAPLTILEAYALGKPVIGTNVRGIRDLIINGSTGVLAEENANALSKKIMEIRNNNSLYEKMSEYASKYAAEHCDVQKWSNRYAELYRSMVR